MRTLVATDTRGIGDRFATAIALSTFHRRVPHITFRTLDRDLSSVWLLLKPFCSEIVNSDNPASPPAFWEWDANNLVYGPSFYFSRISSIAELTRTHPGAIRRNPFNFTPTNWAHHGEKYIVLHPYASDPNRSMPEEDIAEIKSYCHKKGIQLYILPLPNTPLSAALKFVNDAALVIAVDSCIAHFAYWLRPNDPTIVCFYCTTKDWLFTGLPEPLPTCFSGTELAKIKAQIDRL